MPVLAGLAIPKTAPNAAGAKQLIEFLDTVPAQARLPQVAGFFPVVSARLSKQVGQACWRSPLLSRRNSGRRMRWPRSCPVGLGAQGGNYNRVFIDTFTRIVINKEDINKVLEDEGQKLQDVLNTAGAPCWKPDPPSTGTCQVGTN